MTPLVLIYHDVNEAYTEIQTLKNHFCEWENTRNGRALVFQMPVIVTHAQPYRRVLFDPIRDANPFFHYMEALWMLAGDNHVAFPAQFAKNIANYSDDGRTLHGAYGHRWRYAWDNDQVADVIEMLKVDPNTRRAVIAMWDNPYDLNSDSKDLPCNTHIYFRMNKGCLTMTVCNRSNDLVWGMLGANVVHMSVLHEYIANAVGALMGDYYQFTNNLHVYEGWEDEYTVASEFYKKTPAVPRWPFSPLNLSLHECEEFVENWTPFSEYRSRILRDNADPMMNAWVEYKNGDLDLALHHASKIHDLDWQVACTLWLERRKK